ncbi:F-box only protein 6-like [Planococcus citri]|uniref:F-box only protein 6-like n=1 Tax=Planococcus citri TaxID=170843 RepID=UPI0031F96865
MSGPGPDGDSDDLNGLVFLQSHYIPEEVLSLILSYVDPKSLVFNCRLVCKMWKYLIDEDVWRILLRTAKQRSVSKLSLTERMALKLPWYTYYTIFKFDPFETNLIRNHCGQKKMKYWFTGEKMKRAKVTSNGWEIETVPVGSDPLPNHEDFDNCTSCFVTSYSKVEKYQIVNLKSFGISTKIMDEHQPTIIASEWYAGRFDCGCKYQMTVSLLDGDKNVLHEKQSPVQIVHQWEGRAWEKVELTFDDYGPNVRYIKFDHEGKDTQFWAGHYGSKMSGAVLKISLPVLKNSDSEELV